MKDAEVIEAMARAMYEAVAIREGHWQRWPDAEDEDRAFSVAQARAAFEVCAPAIRESCAEENARLRAACLCALTAINTGRSEPLFIARNEIENTLEDYPTPTPHDGLTDTSHHAGSSAGESEDIVDRINRLTGDPGVNRTLAPALSEKWCACLKRNVVNCSCGLIASPAPPHQGGKSE